MNPQGLHLSFLLFSFAYISHPPTRTILMHVKWCQTSPIPTPPRSAWITGKIITLAPRSDGDSAKGLASLFSRSLGQILQGKCVIEDRNDARHGFHGFGCKTRTSQRPRRTDHATTLCSSSLRSDSTLPYRLKGGLNPSGPIRQNKVGVWNHGDRKHGLAHQLQMRCSIRFWSQFKAKKCKIQTLFVRFCTLFVISYGLANKGEIWTAA